jgi:hypothetical protein
MMPSLSLRMSKQQASSKPLFKNGSKTSESSNSTRINQGFLNSTIIPQKDNSLS